MRISPIEVKIFKVKEAQVTIIKNKSPNLFNEVQFYALLNGMKMPHGKPK